MKMINQINELLEKAEQDLIDGKYYDAISQAKEAKEEIEYNKEWLLGLQTLLNNTLFKIKKMKEIFSKNKSNMTTRCLPEGIDTILKQKEKLAEAIIGEAQAALKKDTKKRIENLAHPQEVTQNIIGTRKPHYQGSLIVSLSNGVQTLLVKNRIPKKNLLIVQQTDGKRLRTIFNTDGEPVIPVYIKSGYRITGDKIFYKTKDDEPETEGSLS
ncbi:TPA: hypothetical protein DCZ39_07155 [Patescibacteria group bacterium]|nr:hypothetical protein [Candidatus Gracilibacteria bacterium]